MHSANKGEKKKENFPRHHVYFPRIHSICLCLYLSW